MFRKEQEKTKPSADPSVGPSAPADGPSSAANRPAPPPVASADATPSASALLEAQLADLRERLARARADYDNLQRRMTREAGAERDRAKARVLEGFLPLVELAHMAAGQAEAHPGPLSEGVILLAREFDRVLARDGIERTGTVGEKADPSRHEVVATEEARGVEPGCVSRVVQPGFLMDGKVLRYAKVCVAPQPAVGDLGTARNEASAAD